MEWQALCDNHRNGSNSSLENKPNLNNVLIMDGGFGTTLEDTFHKNISSTPLWSAALIDLEPEVIIDTHLAFLRSGSQLILTSTYQCSFKTFEGAGYTPEDAENLMCKAVQLADEARTRFLKNDRASSGVKGARDIKIVLSLGPYGAMLTPAQEFDGLYGPPYGPRAFQEGSDNTNAFPPDENQFEPCTVVALKAFHYERLRVFARRPEIWSLIDSIAFETVPLAREISAIRLAIGHLYEDLGNEGSKPWWISTVWPDGKFPQEETPKGMRLSPQDVLHALLWNTASYRPAPDGIGINCSYSHNLGNIAESFREIIQEENLSDSDEEKLQPWLVLYPNGGDQYDVVNRVWKKGSKSGWAKDLSEIVVRESSSGLWGGVIVGGCCKTGPSDIAALKQLLVANKNEMSL